MRILFVGDVHGSIHCVKSAIKEAVEQGCEVIVQAGDFGFWTHTERGVAFLDEADKALSESDLMLFFVDGNHENFALLEQIPIDEETDMRLVRSHIVHVPRGTTWEWDGITFMGFGGANSIDGPHGATWWQQARGPVKGEAFGRPEIPWINLGGWWPQEEITQEQVDNIEPARIDILVSHDCPAGINIPTIDRTYPQGTRQRALLRQVVDKVAPDLLIHGHYHVAHEGILDNGVTYIVGLSADGTAGWSYFLDTAAL